MDPIKDQMQRMNDEYEEIIEFLESDAWNKILVGLFKDKVLHWKKMLLTDQNMTVEKRNSYILARQLILESIQGVYRRYDLELPKWLEE